MIMIYLLFALLMLGLCVSYILMLMYVFDLGKKKNKK